MLKADLHLHSNEDNEDSWVEYDSKELIDKAAELGFEVLSFTFHDQYYYPEKIIKYANNKGIILIQGVEKTIKGKHVLVYNITEEEFNSLNDFEDLKKLNGNSIIIAPHPFFITGTCLKSELIKNIDVFHGIEYSHFYNHIVNFNKKAVKVSKEYNKTLIGTSDTHKLYQFNKTYSLIDSNKDINSIIRAIKENKVILETKPLNLFLFLRHSLFIVYRKFFRS